MPNLSNVQDENYTSEYSFPLFMWKLRFW